MKLLTTESQRHREIENEQDPRTAAIIGAAIEVHRQLGPGLLESAYEQCLCHELHLRGLSFQCQVDLPVSYKGLQLDCGYKIDLIVSDKLLTYLKLSDKTVGLLINFNTPLLTRGIIRRVL
jgi:PD-(D/E)XK nuclease superfamily